ncbi:MAG: PfkB family carbohydrate kinase [Syntrophaceae bacterium]
MKKGKTVFGIGQCSLDYIGLIKEYPPADSKCEFTSLTVQGGGPAATALAALSRWGLPCSFCGVAGDDLFGRMIRDSLAEEMIDTENLVVREGCASQYAFIAAEPDKSRRTIFWQRPGGAPLAPGEIDRDKLCRSRLLHTDGLYVEASLHAAGIARKKGIPVSVDAGTLREGTLDLARLSDYFIASESFARQLMGRDDPEGACRAAAQLGPRLAAVTLGARGYVAFDGRDIIKRPAYRIRAVDTTGCGDVFHAGFMYGVLNGLDMVRSLDLGAWAASRAALKPGGRSGIPSLAGIKKHIKKQQGRLVG